MLVNSEGERITQKAVFDAHHRGVCPVCRRVLTLDVRLDDTTLRVRCSGQACEYAIEVKRGAYLYRRFRPDVPSPYGRRRRPTPSATTSPRPKRNSVRCELCGRYCLTPREGLCRICAVPIA